MERSVSADKSKSLTKAFFLMWRGQHPRVSSHTLPVLPYVLLFYFNPSNDVIYLCEAELEKSRQWAGFLVEKRQKIKDVLKRKSGLIFDSCLSNDTEKEKKKGTAPCPGIISRIYILLFLLVVLLSWSKGERGKEKKKRFMEQKKGTRNRAFPHRNSMFP